MLLRRSWVEVVSSWYYSTNSYFALEITEHTEYQFLKKQFANLSIPRKPNLSRKNATFQVIQSPLPSPPKKRNPSHSAETNTFTMASPPLPHLTKEKKNSTTMQFCHLETRRTFQKIGRIMSDVRLLLPTGFLSSFSNYFNLYYSNFRHI